MLILKLKYFVHYYKSKILKKKCKKNYKDLKIQFEYNIKEKNFSNKWFLNNFDIFNFFYLKTKILNLIIWRLDVLRAYRHFLFYLSIKL